MPHSEGPRGELRRIKSNHQGFRLAWKSSSAAENGKSTLRKAKSVLGFGPPSQTVQSQAPIVVPSMGTNTDNTTRSTADYSPSSTATLSSPNATPHHRPSDSDLTFHDSSYEPSPTPTYDSSNTDSMTSPRLRSKASLASLGRYIGSLWSSSPEVPPVPSLPDLTSPSSPYSCDSSSSSLDSLEQNTTAAEISFDTEQLARHRAAEWVEATKPPLAVRPPTTLHQARRHSTVMVGLGIDTVSFIRDHPPIPPPHLATSPTSDPAGPLICAQHARPQPFWKEPSASHAVREPSGRRVLRQSASVPILRQALHIATSPMYSPTSIHSQESASTVSSKSKKPRLLKKAASYATLRKQPLKPLLTLQEDLIKSKHSSHGVPPLPQNAAFQASIRAPAAAPKSHRAPNSDSNTVSTTRPPLRRAVCYTSQTSTTSPDSHDPSIPEANRRPPQSDGRGDKENRSDKPSRSQNNSKAQRSLEKVLTNSSNKPTQPFDVGIIPPAGVRRVPKAAALKNARPGSYKDKRPLKVADSVRISVPSIVVQDFSDDNGLLS